MLPQAATCNRHRGDLALPLQFRSKAAYIPGHLFPGFKTPDSVWKNDNSMSAASLIAGLEHIVRENEPLAPYTSLGIGGVAEFFAEPTTVEELTELVRRFGAANQPMRLLGGGSNVLVRDEGVPGLVVHLGAPEFCQLEADGNQLHAGGGARLSHFISTAVREGMAGPEQLVGIPGTIGGALHANTGAGGFDIGSWLVRAEVLTRTGERLIRERNELVFSYRASSLNELVILRATFGFERESPSELTRRMQKNWIVRRASQPSLGEPAAYVFKDHGGESAASLIERAGLKGTQVGEVEVLDRNCNYFVAKAGASSADFLRLVDLVRRQVEDRLDIKLALALQVW
jgi:UDP-N-acetylmuramate dehydrogenase